MTIGPALPQAIYVWLVPSEHELEQPGSWRIRKWDIEPFPEANYTLSAGECSEGYPGIAHDLETMRELLRQARGWLSEWLGLLDHCGFQNATHIMRLDGVRAMIGRIDALKNAAPQGSEGTHRTDPAGPVADDAHAPAGAAPVASSPTECASHPAGENACDGKEGYFTAAHLGRQWVCTDKNCSWRRAQNPRGENDVDARPALEREARPAETTREQRRPENSRDSRRDGNQSPSTGGRIEPCAMSGIYVASRVKQAEVWKAYRAKGWKINSSWIDEAGEGETADFGELWQRIRDEIARSHCLVFYAAGVDDFPFKGALVEVGMALAMGKLVLVALENVMLDGRTMRPVGSWLLDRNVRRFDTLEEAMDVARGVDILCPPAQSLSSSIAPLPADIERRMVEMIRYIGVKAGVSEATYGAMCHEARCILRSAHLDYALPSAKERGDDE